MTTLYAINDLKRHTAPLADEIKKKLSEITDSGWFVLGNEVKSFEASFANYCGTSFCVSVANGTEALEISLRACQISNNHQVATVANAGMYSTTAILNVGANPVFIDINPSTLTMCINDLKEKLQTNKVHAIIVTHLYGQLADIEDIVQLAKEHQIPVIEDCAQAHGARRNSKNAGSYGDIGCFSFYPTKNLGAMGDGGAIVTSNQTIKERLLLLRQYGWSQKYTVTEKYCKNSRLDEIQAAVLNIKLPYLDQWNSQRRTIVRTVSETCRNVSTLTFPQQTDESYVGHLFIIQTKERDSLRSFLKEKSVPSEIHYPIPDHRQPLFKDEYKGLILKQTEAITNQILTLPCFPEMTNEEAMYIAKCLQEFDQCYR